MNTHESGASNRDIAIQPGRTEFHERLIDSSLRDIDKLTGQILRWPIPRPGLQKQLNRSLGLLAWSASELGDSLHRDRAAVELDLAVEVDEILSDDAAAEAALTIVENS